MESFFNLLETVFFSKIIGDIDLYTILSGAMKFIFVLIVLLFISRIVRMISLDIKQTLRPQREKAASLRLMDDPAYFDFPIRSQYFLSDNNSIGRADDNSIVLKNPVISKHQARIVRHDGVFFIDDLKSTNVTMLNRKALEGPVQLVNGDIISMAGIEFLFGDGENYDF